MKKILIADDEFDLTSTLRAVLERRGYEVVVCSTGREALECVTDAKPDLVLLDVMLPRGNGYEIIEKLRKIAGFEKTPVVLMNSFPPPEGRAVLWQDFLKKPLAVKSLFESVERLIGPPAPASVRASAIV
jgi:DNA-binding response OmpR family regulator